MSRITTLTDAASSRSPDRARGNVRRESGTSYGSSRSSGRISEGGCEDSACTSPLRARIGLLVGHQRGAAIGGRRSPGLERRCHRYRECRVGGGLRILGQGHLCFRRRTRFHVVRHGPSDKRSISFRRKVRRRFDMPAITSSPLRSRSRWYVVQAPAIQEAVSRRRQEIQAQIGAAAARACGSTPHSCQHTSGSCLVPCRLSWRALLPLNFENRPDWFPAMSSRPDVLGPN